MKLFVLDIGGNEVPTYVSPATAGDLQATAKWQTKWTSKAAQNMPNKVALRRTDTNGLLGLMAYAVDDAILAVEIIYVESADHSNANLLHEIGGRRSTLASPGRCSHMLCRFLWKTGMTAFLYLKRKPVNWWNTISASSAQVLWAPMILSAW